MLYGAHVQAALESWTNETERKRTYYSAGSCVTET